MANLNIPSEYRLGVSKIRTLDEQSVRAIRDALDRALGDRIPGEARATLATEEAAIAAVSSVSKEGSANVREIARAIVALYAVKSLREVSTEEFADYVSDAMESLSNEELRLPHAERADFRKKLLILLGSEFLGLASKVYDLATEDERTFCNARILTDLRPVFGTSLDEGPKAMVIVHMLKLEYHQGSDKHQQFYVSLDANDLRTLRKLIDRAEAKAQSLKSVVGNVRLLGLPRESK